MLILGSQFRYLTAIIGLTILVWVSANADQIEPPPTTTSAHDLAISQIENLALLGKIWGYLKYHHPTITGGCIDWDKELLDKIPALLAAADRKPFLNELLSWVDGLESPDICTGIIANEQHFGPRIAWLDDRELLSSELHDFLRSIEIQKFTHGQHYITQQPGVGNPLFNKESRHTNVDDFDWRYRLLALYRFWNIIEYWFPYRDVIDEDWDFVLAEFIPRLHAAEDREAYVLELAMLVAKINDGHANLGDALYIRPPAGRAMPPFAIRMVEGKPFVWRRFKVTDSDAASPDAMSRDELRLGDVILAVDGTPVEEVFKEASPYYGASNDTSKQRQIAQFLLFGNGDSVSVKVERNGEVLDITNRRLARKSLDIRLQHWHDRDGETFQLLSDDIAYLKLSTIESNRTAEYVKAADGTKGLVIDIRSYPASFVVFSLGQHLMTVKTPFARFTRGNLSEPGSFIWMEPVAIEPAEPHYAGKVIILVDGGSMSQSEYTAMAFRAVTNAVVIGSQTAGADGNVSRIPLPGGYTTGMSGIGVFYPDKSPTQRIGIVPDIEAKPTIAGLRAGRDEVLEVAIRQILGDDTPESEIRELAAFPR